jgi:hypothetical protein
MLENRRIGVVRKATHLVVAAGWFVVLALPPVLRAQGQPISVDEAVQKLKSFNDEDAKLRATFRELVPLYRARQANIVKRDVAAAQAAQVRQIGRNAPYSDEARRLDKEIQRQDKETYFIQMAAMRSWPPVLYPLTNSSR